MNYYHEDYGVIKDYSRPIIAVGGLCVGLGLGFLAALWFIAQYLIPMGIK